MTNDTDDTHEFTTDSSPGEQAFESTVDDAVAFFETAITTEGGYYGARTDAILRSSVRATLAAAGSVSPEQVAHDLSDQAARDADVEPILRRLEGMIDEIDAEDGSGVGGGDHAC